jgi:glycosyltransferase involved in cell wall biosynthesis
VKILIVHNHYQQRGGEDTTVAQETALLRANGHVVIEYQRSNQEASEFTLWQKAMLPFRFIWANDTYQELKRLIQNERPNVAHFHNTHFMISPAAYYACQESGIPVAQTIQNYRLFCPSATFYRDGHICEDCLGKFVPFPGVVHACYRDSRIQTGMLAATLVSHRLLKTWQMKIDKYIVPTQFVRHKLVEGGLPAEEIIVKPNFVYPDPGIGGGKGGYALFAGRLAVEKGIESLLEAWRSLEGVISLKIVGDGPLRERVVQAAQGSRNIQWLGQLPKEEVMVLMREAYCLIFPSSWYEAFPLVIVEAYAAGLPVIAANVGSMAELIWPGRTGLHFEPGNATDLTAQMLWLLSHPQEYREIRQQVRLEFERKYSAQRNYELLMDIYKATIR